MFEQVERTPLGRARRALREFCDLSACRVFTLRQQLAAAAFLAALGALAALLLTDWYARRVPAPVTILQPVIERSAEDYSVYRIPFEHRGAVTNCHIVLWSDRGKWTVRCGWRPA